LPLETGYSRAARPGSIPPAAEIGDLSVKAAVADQVQTKVEKEAGPIKEVATPEFLRLPRETVQPLKTDSANPVRAAWHDAGDEGECCSDADGDRNVEPCKSLVDPDVLLWHAEGDPEDVRPRRVDLLDDRLVLGKGQRAVRRRECTGNLVARVVSRECQPQSGKGRLRVAVEVAAVAFFIGAAEELTHDFGTGSPVDVMVAVSARRPDWCNAIRRPECRAVENGPETGILMPCPKPVETRDHDSAAMPVPRGDPAFDVIDRAGCRDEVDATAEDVHRRLVSRGEFSFLGLHLQLTLGEGAALPESRGVPLSNLNGSVFEAMLNEDRYHRRQKDS